MSTIQKVKERIKLTGRADTLMKTRKKSKLVTIENDQIVKINIKRGKRNKGYTEHSENSYQNDSSNSHLFLTTLNANGLNSTIIRHRLAEWVENKTQKTQLYAANKKFTSCVKTLY